MNLQAKFLTLGFALFLGTNNSTFAMFAAARLAAIRTISPRTVTIPPLSTNTVQRPALTRTHSVKLQSLLGIPKITHTTKSRPTVNDIEEKLISQAYQNMLKDSEKLRAELSQKHRLPQNKWSFAQIFTAIYKQTSTYVYSFFKNT